MTQWIETQASFIKPRDVRTVIDNIANGKVAIIPTDSGYSLLCRLGDKAASNRIRQLRDLDKNHPFTLLCADLTHLSYYARADNVQFRLLKKLFPGAFTCILPASKEVPRLVQHDKRKTIGIRVSDHPIANTIISEYSEALMGVSLANEDVLQINLHDMDKSIINGVDIVIDCGIVPVRPTTVLDLTTMPPEIIRQGDGNVSNLFQ